MLRGGSGSKVGASHAAAVQAAVEGFDQQVSHTFLKLLYSQAAAKDIPADASYWPDVLALADKLDAPAVLQVNWFSLRGLLVLAGDRSIHNSGSLSPAIHLCPALPLDAGL